MSNLRQAAEQALEALDNERYVSRYSHIVAAIDALRAALAEPEPEQKPVAWMFEFPDKRVAPKFDSAPHGGNWVPLYTAPPQRKPLTEEEIEQAYRYIWGNIPENFDHTSMEWIEQGIRYAEQAHGIKGNA